MVIFLLSCTALSTSLMSNYSICFNNVQFSSYLSLIILLSR